MTLFPDTAPKSKKASKRRENDRYLTPPMATSALMQAFPELRGEVLIDPCCGDGRMAAQLKDRFIAVHLNDIDPRADAHFHDDATQPAFWERFYGRCWSVSNPSFQGASKIIWNALGRGFHVAMLLRLTFLEPTTGRQWLTRIPPTAILVLPRIDFIGAGSVDSSTYAWMIWGPVTPGIQILRASDVQEELPI